MPTSFLTREQREAFGRFSGPPSSEDMDRYFHLDGDELATVGQMRGAVNRLGFATLVCSVKFIGTFPTRRDDIPDTVITFLSDQLGGSEPGAFGGYFDSSSPTYKRHTALIRAQFGYRDFHNAPDAILGVSRRLYAFCWAGDDKPVALVQWASHWLVNSKVILPGVSTLERLVGRVRDRARLRLWHRLANGLNDSQRTQIEALFDQGGEHLGGLEVLRASPLKRRQTDFLRHLDRLDALRNFGLRLTPPKDVPATQLERLAQVARRSKPSAIAALKEPRRTATVAALFYTLEASAQDDAVELGEALISDLFREAELVQVNHRQAHQRDLDAAVLLLRNLAEMVIIEGDEIPLNDWRNEVYSHWSKDKITQAVATVDTLIQPTSGKPYKELSARWHRTRKLFFNIATRVELAASPGGHDVLRAIAWLREQPDWSKATVKKAPTGVISKSWRPYVMDAAGRATDPKAYVFATVDAWHKAVKRRDVFAAPGIRYADPRIGMLEGRAWDNTKGIVCRTLGRKLDGAAEVRLLTELLDTTFARVAARAEDNPDLRFECAGGKDRIIISKLDRMDEPDSLVALRRQVHSQMPKGGIPDILLEVMSRTGFAKAFTHFSDRSPQIDEFEISLCAALMAQACNIGFEPLIREDRPALNQHRLSWVTQNFIRPETITAANAMIVAEHRKLPIAAHWGDGQTASADGLRFIVPKSAIHAGPNPKYFNRGRGVTWYNMLSDLYSGLGAMVVPGTLRDSLAILALLLEQETELEPYQIMTDSAAYSDSIFGLFWLLGYQFCPRLADIGGARLWRVDKSANYGPFNAISEGTINIKLIVGHLENWLDFRRSTNSWFIGLALLLVLVANGVPFRSFHRHFRDSWQAPPVNAVMLVQPEASQAG